MEHENVILKSELLKIHVLERTWGKWIPVNLSLDISLMMKTEMFLETSVYSPFKILTCLPARQYFVTF